MCIGLIHRGAVHGLDFLASHGFLTVHTPFFMGQVCQLKE
jgi:hypothetical protein